ncbi:uncharacterized protein ColSpa_07085 [Colletotrichum spaethianum]|uniref:Uncharacterized protein n=1 Tax=Colletotrichum spaethianum TaxID=700344 RepID=A0AA37LIJ4_9PEZI|nr:uncharacterized protein ColSpa_07085 [Colletotrichum spaethianum]GKT46904.1 hypothetical protein ColSpa_07085 [Colletotrichum spaethianum]
MQLQETRRQAGYDDDDNIDDDSEAPLTKTFVPNLPATSDMVNNIDWYVLNDTLACIGNVFGNNENSTLGNSGIGIVNDTNMNCFGNSNIASDGPTSGDSSVHSNRMITIDNSGKRSSNNNHIIDTHAIWTIVTNALPYSLLTVMKWFCLFDWSLNICARPTQSASSHAL